MINLSTMVNRRRGRFGGQSAPRSLANVRLQQQLTQQKRQMLGPKIVPSQVPRGFVQYPWNTWTYESVFTTTDNVSTFTVGVDELTADLVSKLGLSSSSNIRLKVQTAQVWCTASGLVYPELAADFFEINGNSVNAASVRSSQRDKGTLNMPARLGYMYPVSDSKDVLNSGDATLNIVAASAVEAGSNLTVRVHMLWQIRPTSSFIASNLTE